VASNAASAEASQGAKGDAAQPTGGEVQRSTVTTKEKSLSREIRPYFAKLSKMHHLGRRTPPGRP